MKGSGVRVPASALQNARRIRWSVPSWTRAVVEARLLGERTPAEVSSSGLGGLEGLSPQPSEGRLEAGRIVDARFPAEHLSYSAIAEILVVAEHLRGLTGHQRGRV